MTEVAEAEGANTWLSASRIRREVEAARLVRGVVATDRALLHEAQQPSATLRVVKEVATDAACRVIVSHTLAAAQSAQLGRLLVCAGADLSSKERAPLAQSNNKAAG